MAKKLIAMLLVLVMCFTLVTMVAAAEDASQQDGGGFNLNFDMFKKTFELPPIISQLFDMFQLGGIWNSIKNILLAVSDIDSLF